MNIAVDKWIDDHSDELVEGLRRCLAFRTILDGETAGEGKPFGETIAACLEDTLSQAKALGFSVKNLDGYCGCVDFGEGEEQLGMMCHLDVVPEGNGWKYPPYAGEIHDGFLYARGTMDDKGPAFAAMFAMKAIMELGLPMKRRVRLILGCDEESGMRCIRHFNEVEPAPTMCFSPDAEYPVVNSEKNGYHGAYKKEYASTLRISSGEVGNAVPGECVCELPLSLNRILPIIEAFMEKSEYACSAEATEYGSIIKMTGVAAHASTPDHGKNAFTAMLTLLDKLPLEKEDAFTVGELSKLLNNTSHGENFGLECEDESGNLTFMPGGAVKWDESGIQRLTIDIRAPISMKGDTVSNSLNAKFNPIGLVEEHGGWSEGYYIPADSELVKSLLDVYAARTGKEAKPLAIGGGTYARKMKNAVAFGIERPGEPASIHMANECISVDHLIEDTKIIADAIIALAVK